MNEAPHDRRNPRPPHNRSRGGAARLELRANGCRLLELLRHKLPIRLGELPMRQWRAVLGSQGRGADGEG
eukprot:scaffold89404_cov46-Phaeocystis_antarctica.AAC.2